MLQRDTGHVTCEAVAGKAMTARGASPPASASLPPPTSSRWEDVPDTMEHTLLSPTCPSAPHLHPSAPSSSIGSPSPAALPPPLVPPSNPLFLSIDASSVTTVRACILDHQLCVVWTEQVLVDTDLPEYGTRQGVYTQGDVVTCPSEARLHALDLLLEKLARDCPDPTLLSRVVAVSGAGQPHTLHYLSHDFPDLLDVLAKTPHARISSVLTAADAFSLAHPATTGDSSAAPQVRELELNFGTRGTFDETDGSAPPVVSVAQRIERGREALARRTGSRPTVRSGAAQLLRVVQTDMNLQGENGPGVSGMDRTGRVVLEGGLLASVFLGRYAPVDAADAGSTGLFDPVRGEWDEDLLGFVDSGGTEGETAMTSGQKLGTLLGEVELDGGVELGKISPYFVQRFGFAPNCIVAPFSGADPSAFLAYPLKHSSAQRDALVSLSAVAETDTLAVPLARFVPSPERSVVCHPAKGWWDGGRNPASGKADGREWGHGLEDGEATPDYVAFISSHDAGIGRALSRDMYANGEWDVFAHLSAIVPHGGTIGLDDKCYSLFYPHGEATSAQGLLRFANGARVPEFADRKVNPRLLVESQAMSLRVRLGHIYRALLPEDGPSLTALRKHDPVGFPSGSPSCSPTRLVLVGEAAQNPALASIFSSMLHSPAFLPLAGGLNSDASGQSSCSGGTAGQGTIGGRQKASASALGAGYKAAWACARASQGEQISFETFLSRALDAQAVELDDPLLPEQTAASGGKAAYSLAGALHSSGETTPSRPGTSASTSQHQRRSGAAATHASHGRGMSGSLSSADGSAQGYDGVKGTGEGATGRSEEELAPDPPGLTLVAVPDEDLGRYYDSMLPEFVRLERAALKGLV